MYLYLKHQNIDTLRNGKEQEESELRGSDEVTENERYSKREYSTVGCESNWSGKLIFEKKKTCYLYRKKSNRLVHILKIMYFSPQPLQYSMKESLPRDGTGTQPSGLLEKPPPLRYPT